MLGHGKSVLIKMLEPNKKNTLQFMLLAFRHGIVSLISGTVEFLFFILFLNHLAMPLPLSYIFSFFLSTVVAFLGHNFLTFKLNRLELRSTLYFIAQIVLAILIGYSLMQFFLKIGLEVKLAKLAQMILTFLFNLLFGRYISFKSYGLR